ncbi:MAG: AI-2E family transporter [Planctomycetia bacterium]|nr:AI-2E family transporter [Planctomycetia bacterium]
MIRRLQDEQNLLITGSLLIIAFVALSFALYFTRVFMIPFIFSLFIIAMVSPVNYFLVVRCRLHRMAGFFGSLFIVLLIIFALVITVRFAFHSVKDASSRFEGSVGEFVNRIDRFLLEMDVSPDYINARNLLEPLRQEGPVYLKYFLSLLQSVFSGSVLVLLFSIFILLGRDPRKAINNKIYLEIEQSIQKYLNIKFIISLATGIMVGFTLWLLGLEMWFLFGLLTFILNFIPSLGSIIATILPLPLAIIQPGFTNQGVFLVFLIPAIIQNFMGNLLEPKLQGVGLKLHPVTILLALGFWGVVWGPVGMLLAAPITAAMRIILMEFKMTEPVAELMAGQLSINAGDYSETEE